MDNGHTREQLEREGAALRGQEVSHRPLSESGEGEPASEHGQGRGSSLRRVSVFGSAGAILIALLGLLSYVPGLQSLGRIQEGYIPMAPSTAVSFIVLGAILLVMTLRSQARARLVVFGALAGMVSLFGVLEVIGHFTGKDLNLEDALVPAAGHLQEIPIARMSPVTGAAFFLAGLAVLALILRQSRTPGRATRLWHCGGSLAVSCWASVRFSAWRTSTRPPAL